MSGYILPRISVKKGMSKLLLYVLGRNNFNPQCHYCIGNLLRPGFRRPENFEVGLSEYISSHQLTRPTQSVSDART